MRTVMITLLFAASTYGDERTWTIATSVQTAQAELVAVRGDIVYLKMGDRVESVPIANLSVADQQYIASLPLAPIVPGPALGTANADVLPAPNQTAGAAMPAEASILRNTPAVAPPVVEEAIPMPGNATNSQRAAASANPGLNGSRSPQRTTATSRTAQYRATGVQPRAVNGAPAGQYLQPSQARPNTAAQQRNNEPPPGLLGFRARRAERLRGR